MSTQAPPPAVPISRVTAPDPSAAPARGSSWLEFLPAIYQTDEGGGPNHLGRFLLAFEQVLTGEGAGPEHPSLESSIAALASLFVPLGHGSEPQAPPEFLEWLGRWVALSLRADIDVPRRRLLLAHAVPLYRWRGTRRGLAEMIHLYTSIHPEITEPSAELRVGLNTRVGGASLGGGLPHTFEVRIRITEEMADQLGTEGTAQRLRSAHEVVTAIIEANKPAHTIATLVVDAPSMRIGIRSTIGLDTRLSADPAA